MPDGNIATAHDTYDALAKALSGFMPSERLIRDPLRTFAYGTDASFYRLIPQIVVKAENEGEIIAILAQCRHFGTPITFRAAGTSLSGQAVTDSVLLTLGEGWTSAHVEQDGAAIRLQPGVIGADANRRLAAFARKIGPDPASIDSAKIGGMAANNSSGMCCGTSDNSYQTLMSMRLVLVDGTVVDTADPASVTAFRASHASLLQGLAELGRTARENTALAERIRHKFSIKNTTGYALNSLVDFNDPIDILQHLMIGSEGTLGFISEITYRTVPDHAHKASALMLFPDIAEACRTVAVLKATPVSAVELMDRAALKSVEDKPGMPAEIVGIGDGVTALLVETRAETAEGLAANMDEITKAVGPGNTLSPVVFTADPRQYGTLWNIRKGLFPAVGAVRKTGTTVIIEDVAFKIPDLAQATLDLQALFLKHGYSEAIIFGHALDGNLHFVFTQDFGIAAEVERYAAFMDDVCALVAGKYDGSLKAEHGTGRNMAPFVEMEWGRDAYALMVRIKELLDPRGLLNPGVILESDARAHLKNLKPLPAADSLVDTCIECGFCERMCPSHGMTLSPRQRITTWREISRLAAAGIDTKRERALRDSYSYQALDTCAACGLCATACPVGIETGLLTKSLRGRQLSPLSHKIGELVANHFGTAITGARAALVAGRLAKALSGGIFPKGASLPTPGHLPNPVTEGTTTVVYVPSCANRAMGAATDAPEHDSLPQRMTALLRKAGFRVVLPNGLADLCCGQAFESKGMADLAAAKSSEMEAALLVASQNGAIPVLMDASACSLRLKTVLDKRLTVLDSIEFLHDQVLPRLDVAKQQDAVLIHLNCSARRMGLEGKMLALANACAETVVVPEGVGCCGFAGDKGYTIPELNDHALRKLPQAVPPSCEGGYSSNRTCEIGLSDHSGKPYRSIAYLLDRVGHRK